MCQKEIIDFMRANPGKLYTTKDLARELNISQSCVTKNIRNLRRYNIVKWQLVRRKATSPVYVYCM